MSYKQQSIYQAISDIDAGKVFLPALQRRFVWSKAQIQLLFDSIMRGYPFGTFLFWKLSHERANEYVFYKFKTAYDSRDPFNERKTGAFTTNEIIGVLDGQQRLSSIYVGLQGSHTEKGYRKRANRPDAYEQTQLYLNLLSLPYRIGNNGGLEQDETINFEFRFLTEESFRSQTSRRHQVNQDKEEHVCWFKVGDVMCWPAEPEIDFFINQIIGRLTDQAQASAVERSRSIIRYGLDLLHKRVHSQDLINYYEVSKEDLEAILKIFVRVNSGGTVLGKTDLLFSTIVATWDKGREKIEELQKLINGMGLGFNFGTEYLMRCCLVLSDGPVLYKVNSFKAENVQSIRDQWPQIAKAISRTVELLTEFGFSSETLTSQNATIPIAYYIYKGGSLDKDSKSGLRMYLIRALLTRLFGSSQDQLLTHLRSKLRTETNKDKAKFVLKKEYAKFDFEQFSTGFLPGGRSLKITQLDLDRILEYRKGSSAFAVLQLLYPSLRYREVSFHQDHIHPAARFCKDAFDGLGLSQEERELWTNWRDQVPNLQLLEGMQNQSKNDMPIVDWLAKMSSNQRESFKTQNHLPVDVDLKFCSFREFFEARRQVLRVHLQGLLDVTDQVQDYANGEEMDQIQDDDLEQAAFESSSDESWT